MPLKREIRHHTSERSTRSMDEESEDDIMSYIPSWFIVVVSLLFVAIFGGALIGGIASGDPNNGFFITSIIVASVLAISVALGVSIRYYLINRAKDDDEYLPKDDIRGTFSSSDEGRYNVEESFNRRPDHDHCQTQPQPNHYLTHTHVESQIKEIQTKSVFGEMSVLSPQTYDEESLTTIGQGRRGFNFSSITSSKRESKVNMREDPPEGAGLSFQTAWNTRGQSQDPSAPKFSTDGEIIADDDIEHKSDTENISENNDDENTVVTVENDRYKNCNDDEGTVVRVKNADNSSGLETELSSKGGSRERRRSRSRSRSKSKSPSARSKSKSPSGSRSAKSTSSSETKTSSKRKQNLQKTDALRPPSSTKSGATNSMTASPIPPTPAASETGSFASSFFKPLSGVFGKNKKTQSNAGASDIGSIHTTTTKHKDLITNDKVPVVNSKKGRPPMMPPSILKKVGDGDKYNKGTSNIRRGMETIGDRIGSTPSTPGNKSTFTIPPPRRIPQTPNGSVVFSEFQSVAGSAYSNGAASSTFDPQAHQRALQKMQKNEASIGANPVGGNPMPMYYEDEDDDDDKESSVAPSAVLQSEALAYDVFAPPGAIGIVVDTNDKGCIVHSLKKSSPMQGLMNRGDLIIALDDFDVRNMSPASLTKLMAKKSQQAERKFTLIPSDSVQ